MNSPIQPLVSIVVPAYNEAEFVVACLESILAQTYENWECLFADNCSTDGTIELARRYATMDSRIRIIENTEFLRAVPNYNRALRQMSPESKYCKIVFADDWIFPECLERMVTIGEEYPSVGIVGAYGLQGRQVMWTGLPCPSKVVSGREICRKLFLEELYIFGTGTSLLLRSSVVREHSPFYNETNLHADSEACLSVLRTCDWGFVNQVLTFTRVREGSLTSFSAQMNTLIAGRLYDLVTYGRDFLNDQEFEGCLKRMLSRYYGFLGKNLLRRRNDTKFWEYHERKLTEARVGFDRGRVFRAFLGEAMDVLLNPKRALGVLLKRKSGADNPPFHHSLQERKEC